MKHSLLSGKITLHQPPRGEGYRVNVDALHLATFAGTRRARHAFDLGAGVGAVALTLLSERAVDRVTLVEIDPRAADIARRNLVENGWADRGDVICADVREAAREHRGEATLVVCNPPYIAPGRGRAPKEPARARARSGELGTFVQAARVLCARRARACFVYPAPELTTLLETLRKAGLEPKRMRAVHASAVRPARVVLVEAQPAKKGGLVIESPIVER